MHNARRGIRNVWRSKARTITVTLLIGLAMCLSVTMMAINAAVDDQLLSIEASVGTIIEVRPAGSFGSFGRGEPLSVSILEGIADIPNIVEVAPVLVYQYTQRLNQGELSSREALASVIRNRMAVMGILPGQPLRIMGGGIADISKGRNFTATDEGKNVIILGETYAAERELTIGSEVIIEDNAFEVIGISSVGNRFGDSSVFLPLETAQRLFDMEGLLTQVYVTVDALPKVAPAMALISSVVGEEADVVSQGDATMERVRQSMDIVRGTTSTGLWLALVTCGLIIFFTMVLIIRERQREIGVLKAIGSSDSDLLFGFAWEALALAAVGVVVGIAFFTTAGQAVATRLISHSISPTIGGGAIAEHMRGTGLGQAATGGGLRSAGRLAVAGGFLQSQLGDMHVSLSLSLLAKSLAAALGLGLLGGLLPALYALRLKPAEVLRND